MAKLTKFWYRRTGEDHNDLVMGFSERENQRESALPTIANALLCELEGFDATAAAKISLLSSFVVGYSISERNNEYLNFSCKI